MPRPTSPAALLPCVFLLACNVASAATDPPRFAAWPTFEHALCTCGNITGTTSTLTVEGYDSSRDAPAPAASIGVGGTFQGSSVVRTSGSVYVSGAGNSHVSALQAGEDVFLQGPLTTSGNFNVDGNTWLGGDTKIGGFMHVRGTTTLAQSAHLRVARGGTPSTRTQDFDVQPPCDCASDASALILQRIRAALRDNDNKRVGLSADTLHNVQHSVRLLLPDGDYYLTSIGSVDPITLVAEGNVNLYVAGNVASSAQLHIVSGRGGHLEMFVAGNINVGPNFFFGNTRIPGHARLYVAGKSVHTAGALNISGNVYAPHADLMLSTESKLRGSGWFNTLSHSKPLSIVYDPAVLRE